MRHYQIALAVLSAAILAGCGGGNASGGDQSTKIKFTSQVSFGDSLSDVGTYDVGTVAALHGGKFTVNTLTPTAQNWTELMAATLGLPAPCPAETGLQGAAAQGFSVAPTMHSGCFGYGQGGARVTLPYGPSNANLPAALGGSTVVGALTVPVVTQIQNHLNAVGGKFSGTEIVFVLAGANDVFVQLASVPGYAQTAVTNLVTKQVQADIAAGTCTPTDAQASNCQAAAEGELWQASLGSASAVTAAVTAQVQSDVKAGTCTPTDAQATNCQAQAETELVTAYLTAQGTAAGAAQAVTALGQAGAELAGYINNLIIANGAKYVTVVNIPDIGTTPLGNSLTSSELALVNTMVSTFNTQLQNGVASSGSVVFVDANTQSHLNTQSPAQYGLTNVTVPACNLSTTVNPLGSSLTCNTSNVISGDVSHYLFADSVHPSPYGYSLLAKYVATQMSLRGWL